MSNTKTLIEVRITDGFVNCVASMDGPKEKEAALMGLVGLIMEDELFTKAVLCLLKAASENPTGHKKFMDEHTIKVTGLSEKI